jgi:predicted tellurium resistance membrane protein TerC
MEIEIVLSLLTLTALEVVLGIDNIVVIAIVAGNLPEHQRDRARVVGLSLALIMRLLLLLSLGWIAGLTQPLVTVLGHAFTGRDLLMLAGGLFLMAKAVREIHHSVEEADRTEAPPKAGSFAGAIGQILVLDLVFSLDSVITAVGMVREIWIMAIAVVLAVIIMLISSRAIVRFIHDFPTIKVLALAFVLLIGTALVADGMGFDIPKGYLYFAMLFSVMVEGINVTIARRKRRAAERRKSGG